MKKHLTPRNLTVTALALAPAYAAACDCGAPHTPSFAGHAQEPFFASVRTEYSAGDTVYAGSDRVSNGHGEYLRSRRIAMLAGYAFGNGLSLYVAPSHVKRDYRAVHEGEVETGSVTGYADLPFGLSYATCLLHGEKAQLHGTFSAAVTAPTGDTAPLKEAVEEFEESAAHAGHEHGAVHAHDLAPGTGAWGGMLAGTLAFEHGDFLAEAGAHYTWRPEGDYGYDFADIFGWNLAAGAFVYDGQQNSVAVLLTVSGDHAGDDRIRGRIAERTNHDLVYAGPAVRLLSVSGARLDAGVELPVYARTGAAHTVSSWRAQAGVSFTF